LRGRLISVNELKVSWKGLATNRFVKNNECAAVEAEIAWMRRYNLEYISISRIKITFIN